MKAFSKALTGMAVAVAALASIPAQAVVVSFGGQNTNVAGGDKSGLTSVYVPVSNMANPTSGLFIETFDQATALQGFGSPLTTSISGTASININPLNTQALGGRTVGAASGCSVNSFGAVTITTSGTGGFGVQQGTTSGIAAAPGVPSAIGDSTCFGFGPGPAAISGAFTAKVKIDYSNFIPLLTTLGLAAANDSIGYLGVYYGSIDTYNDITFYNKGVKVSYSGLLSDGVIKGSEILSILGGASGNQSGAGSNVYVNLMFAANETFDAFEFSTTSRAYEFDNVVVGLASKNIPEPGSLALVGLGLLGLVAARRRKLAK